MKITDLEKFALEHIYRPYSNILLGYDTRWDRLPLHYKMDDVLIHFKENPEWENLVMDRIYRIGFKFPSYIQHPLVDYIKNWKPRKYLTPLHELRLAQNIRRFKDEKRFN